MTEQTEQQPDESLDWQWVQMSNALILQLSEGWSSPCQIRVTGERPHPDGQGTVLELEARQLSVGPRGEQRIVGYRVRTPAGDVIAKPGDLDVIVFDPQAGNTAYVRRLVTPGE